jgi:hypothetical protein
MSLRRLIRNKLATTIVHPFAGLGSGTVGVGEAHGAYTGRPSGRNPFRVMHGVGVGGIGNGSLLLPPLYLGAKINTRAKENRKKLIQKFRMRVSFREI